MREINVENQVVNVRYVQVRIGKVRPSFFFVFLPQNLLELRVHLPASRDKVSDET